MALVNFHAADTSLHPLYCAIISFPVMFPLINRAEVSEGTSLTLQIESGPYI